MSLCSYSSETHSGSFLVIENTFINEYLPAAPPSCVKVYLYGLYLCTNPNSIENSIDNFCHVLNMEAGEIKDAFEYWQAEGLVQILETPDGKDLNVKFLPVAKRVGSSKKIANKYSEFNSKIQAVIKGRMITPNEYSEYYTFIESSHMDKDAFVAVAEYCTKLKGEKVGYPYIITVAKSFSNDGILSCEQVAEKLNEHQEITPELNDLYKALGKKSSTITLEDKNIYIKLTKEYGFTHGTIKEIAKTLKDKPNATMFKLDTLFSSYYKLNLFSSKEITEYNKNREEYFELAKDITKTLGLYYDNLETIIENYLMDWKQKGFENKTLKTIAYYCLKKSTRTIEGMNNTIQKFHKLGLISEDSIYQYMEETVFVDNQIQEVLDACNILRNVTVYDRSNYQTWTQTWHLPHETILYVAELSKDKMQPIQYMNKLLSNMFEAKVETLDEAKKYMENNKPQQSFESKKKTTRPSTERNFDQKDLDALFGNLKNIEL